MLLITASNAWKTAYPGALIGLLEVADVDHKSSAPALDAHKRVIEDNLRQCYREFTRAELVKLPVMAAYVRYYKRFSKTYHVLLQLESVVLKGKRLPSVSPLVDANFCAELATLALTAGHDASTLTEPILMDVAREDDTMLLADDTVKSVQAGDMVMRDAHGIRCSILYGQDYHSRIMPESKHVLYVSYAPAGVPPSSVEDHLNTILAHIRLFSPSVRIRQQRIISA